MLPRYASRFERISVKQQLGLLNDAQKIGDLIHREGNAIEYNLSGGLIREDSKVVYPIREGIPVLLSEEAIILSEELKVEFLRTLES